MPICICGKVLKTDLGASQHGKSCKQYKKNKLSGGTGLMPVPEEGSKVIEDARRQLRQEIIPLAMSTLMAALSGNMMKESRVRAAIKVIEMVGVNREAPPKGDKVEVNFGEDPENQFDKADEGGDEGGEVEVATQKVG